MPSKRAYISPSSFLLQPPNGLTCAYAAQLQEWLPPGGSNNPSEWAEVYRGTTHGFGAAVFHARCDGRARLLVLIRSREGGWLFGGFTALGFIPGEYRHYADPAAFLFSLSNSLGHPEKLEVSPTGMGMDVSYYAGSSASFGDGAGLHVCSDADTVSSSATYTGYSYAKSASAGAHPMAAESQSHWLAAEVVAWVT